MHTEIIKFPISACVCIRYQHCKRISVVLALAGMILRLAQSKSDLLLATLGPPKLARIGKRLSATILGPGPCEDTEDAAAFPFVLGDSFALAISAQRQALVQPTSCPHSGRP